MPNFIEKPGERPTIGSPEDRRVFAEEIEHAKERHATAQGVKVAEVGDVYGTRTERGSTFRRKMETRVNVLGQRIVGGNGTAYSHLFIEIGRHPETNERRFYESNPGTGPTIHTESEVLAAHPYQQIHRYTSNKPLTDDDKFGLTYAAEAIDSGNRSDEKDLKIDYNNTIFFNRGVGGPEQCAQAVLNLQRAAHVPLFVEGRDGRIAPMPRDLSNSTKYHRVPSDMINPRTGLSTDKTPRR